MDPSKASLGFSAIGSEPRLEVLRLLVRAGNQGMSVGDIQQRTKIAASTLAHHLKCLSAAGLVRQERQGRSTINRAEFVHLQKLADYILEECCLEESAGP